MRKQQRVYKVISVILILVLVFSMIINASAASQTIGVNLRDNRPIDIILAGGMTEYNIDSFSNAITAALVSEEVDASRIRVSAIEAKNSSGTSNFPWVKTGKTSKVGVSGSNVSVYGDPVLGYTAGVKVSLTSLGVSDPRKINEFKFQFTLNPSGLIPHPSGSATLSVSGVTFSMGTSSTTVRGPNSSGTLVPYVKSGRDAYTAIVEADRTKYKVYINGAVVMEHNIALNMSDVALNVTYGSHGCPLEGFFSLSGAYLEVKTAKDLIEVVRAPDWRPNSHRFIFDLMDYNRDDFAVGYKVEELVERMALDEAYYIGVTADPNSNAGEMQNFIYKNNGRGKVVPYTTNSDWLNNSAGYIEPIVNKILSGDGKTFLLKDTEISVNNLESLPKDEKWETTYTKNDIDNNGVQIVPFQELEEDPFWTNRLRKSIADFNTKQIGSYRIKYDDAAVKPSVITVHQRPVAQITGYTVTNSVVTLSSNSYDPDVGNLPVANRGIREHRFKWRPAGVANSTWSSNYVSQSGGTATINPTTKHIEVYYSVIDYQGQESMPVIRFVDLLGTAAAPPVADFNLPVTKTSKINWQKLIMESGSAPYLKNVLTDLSYDPTGKPLSSYSWRWYQSDGKTAYGDSYVVTGASINAGMSTFMNRVPAGTWYLGLIVTNSAGKKSAEYKRVVEIRREPYNIWFSDQYNVSTAHPSESNPTGTAIPTKLMKGWNYNVAKFENNSRVITFNRLHGYSAVSTDNNYYAVRDPNNSAPILWKANNLPVRNIELNHGYLWPVSTSQNLAGEVLVGLWGTPMADWSLVHEGTVVEELGGYPLYYQGTANLQYPGTTVGWGVSLNNKVSIMDTLKQGMWQLNARTPNKETTLTSVKVAELNGRSYLDWVNDKVVHYPTNYNYSGSGNLNIYIPSNIDKVSLTGSSNGKSSGGAGNGLVGGTYWRSVDKSDPSVYNNPTGGNRMAPGIANTSGVHTLLLPYKNRTYDTYFYVIPESANVPNNNVIGKFGETYQAANGAAVGGTTPTYADDLWSTSSTNVKVRRLNDVADLYVNESLMTSPVRRYEDINNPTEWKFKLSVPNADNSVLRSWTVEGQYNSNIFPVNTRTATITVPITKSNTKVTILVQAEDPEIQKSYTLELITPNTKNEFEAEVSYVVTNGNSGSATDRETYTGVLSGATYTITLPTRVRVGKLNIKALNPESVIQNVGVVAYNANSISPDHELPYHNNPNTGFTVKTARGNTKKYNIVFKKTNVTPSVVLDNVSELEGLFSPQGNIKNTSNSNYTRGDFKAFEELTPAGSGYTGSGIPIRVKVSNGAASNKEQLQGVDGYIEVRNQRFPIHWGGFDGPTYINGDISYTGYAIIAKDRLVGLNGIEEIKAVISDYDDPDREVSSSILTTIGTFKVDSAAPVVPTETKPDGTDGYKIDAETTETSTNGDSIVVREITDGIDLSNTAGVWGMTLKYGRLSASGWEQSIDKRLDEPGRTSYRVDLPGLVAGPYRFEIVLFDNLGNESVPMTFNLDYSESLAVDPEDSKSLDAHYEFGRNSDGYYLGTRDNYDEEVGKSQFNFIE
jgi:hypothetical protein